MALSRAVKFDIDIWGGNDAPSLILRPKDSNGAYLDLTGYVYVLTFKQGVNSDIFPSLISGVASNFVVDVDASTITWTPTLAESRAFPIGNLSRYELEQRVDGTQETIMYGKVTGLGGDNVD